MEAMITTSRGTSVELDSNGERDFITLDNPAAPSDMRHCEAGRVVGDPEAGFGFQPAPFAAWALTPEVLRAIADLIDGIAP